MRPEYCKRNGSKTVLGMWLIYRWCCKCASNDDQKGPTVKRNGTPDRNSWLRACVECNSESRIGTLPWASPDMSSITVRTQLEVRFIAKHHTFPVSMIPA
ncbi:hypothetical protein TNCV_852741 [Trichonephila clavipes]|nr:hypothetical protein TNCV_852741 [Trichonephila clavipes]